MYYAEHKAKRLAEIEAARLLDKEYGAEVYPWRPAPTPVAEHDDWDWPYDEDED